jgi:hypothetical protein
MAMARQDGDNKTARRRQHGKTVMARQDGDNKTARRRQHGKLLNQAAMVGL